ncbi:MACPF domain-containing protein CAD1 isoform A [Glycine soja]|uniref:MACPF domain-containing protein CAD1 isoform A n=1 Tax=Glycine soja TaxID=3848 RepID=A0A445J724_GLYSO|nr:MACPF domain-containing protein CAD1 isoform A [Glycine soja]
MGEHVAAFHTATNAVQALNRGFDVNCDTRLLYCKRVAGSRVIHVDEEHVRDLWLFPMFQVTLFRTLRSMWGVAVLESVVIRRALKVFSLQMVEYFNQKANISQSFPLGTFNSAFSFTGSKHIDATETKSLSSDGFYFPLAKVQLINSHLMLQENVERDIPVIYIMHYIGLQVVDSFSFNNQVIHPQPASGTYLSGKDVRVIFRRRGGDDLEQDHSMWLRTVCSSPDVIQMTFCPITDLIDEVPGKEHLAHIIGLYLEYKPPIEELRYFLEFQIAHVWAPLHDRTPGHRRKEPLCPSLQFSIMGQNLYITVGRLQVTGLRLFLEGEASTIG